MSRGPGLIRVTVILAALSTAALSLDAAAEAWTQPKGRGKVIVKYEDMTADQGFAPDGSATPLPAVRRDQSLGVFVEYGLTDRLTVQFKGDQQQGEDALVAYNGRGPLEIGLTWQAWRDERTVVSVYGGYARPGDGRNAGYAAPGVGGDEWEARVALGHTFDGTGTAVPGWRPDSNFIEVQAARRMRDGFPDETRADLTLGSNFGDRWMVLGQAYGGVTDGAAARWLSVETSVVRHLGSWSVQAGWRRTVAGRETPIASGPVVSVWRRF